MRPQIHSPRMALVRQIVACLAVAMALFAFVGCGGESLEGPKIPQQTADELIQKLDDVKTNIDEGDCEGTGSAPSALAAVQKSVDAQADQIGPDIVAGLRELLGDVDAQVNQFCSEQAVDTTETDATTDSTTESKTETETSTETTESTTESTTTEDTKPEEVTPPVEPPGNGPDGNGPPGQSGDQGGFDAGGGGFAPGRVAAGGGSR